MGGRKLKCLFRKHLQHHYHPDEPHIGDLVVMNTKTQVNPKYLKQLKALSWKQIEEIAKRLDVTPEAVSQAIKREGRRLITVDFILAVKPLLKFKSLEDYLVTEKITLPYEHE